MKIAHVISSLTTGGAEKLLLDSVPLYEESGLEIDVITLDDGETAFRSALSAKMKGNIIGLTKKSIYNPFLIFKLIPVLRKYDVIHAHLFPVLYWVVFAKLISFSKTPIIYTEHNTDNRRRRHFFLNKVDKLVYSKLTIIGCISLGVFESLSDYLGYKERLCLIPNGIDILRFSQVREDSISLPLFNEGSFTVIQVSSFRAQKDQETLIAAFQLLPEKIKLILVGDGELRAEREQQVKELRLGDRVKFLGNRYDIPELLNYSKVVVLSSHYEGFGLAAVEGMAAGKPVVASDVSGIREVVEGAGILFRVGDFKELAAHILKLAIDEDHYRMIANNCSTRVELYSIKNMVDEYIKLYSNGYK